MKVHLEPVGSGAGAEPGALAAVQSVSTDVGGGPASRDQADVVAAAAARLGVREEREAKLP